MIAVLYVVSDDVTAHVTVQMSYVGECDEGGAECINMLYLPFISNHMLGSFRFHISCLNCYFKNLPQALKESWLQMAGIFVNFIQLLLGSSVFVD